MKTDDNDDPIVTKPSPSHIPKRSIDTNPIHDSNKLSDKHDQFSILYPPRRSNVIYESSSLLSSKSKSKSISSSSLKSSSCVNVNDNVTNSYNERYRTINGSSSNNNLDPNNPFHRNNLALIEVSPLEKVAVGNHCYDTFNDNDNNHDNSSPTSVSYHPGQHQPSSSSSSSSISSSSPPLHQHLSAPIVKIQLNRLPNLHVLWDHDDDNDDEGDGDNKGEHNNFVVDKDERSVNNSSNKNNMNNNDNSDDNYKHDNDESNQSPKRSNESSSSSCL